MSNSIKVSIIIPVYQVENYLERAVDSVLAQTLQEKEIILVDDGSEDNSPLLCDRYAREYPDVIRVIHKKNEGLGMARNTGVAAARGEYIAFLDSDDTVEPEMYRTLYDKAVEGHYDMVMCDVKIIYVEEQRSTVVSTYPQEQIDLSDYLIHGNNITYSVNKLYRRQIWEENRYEKMLFEDISLIPALVTRYPNIGYVKQPFYHYFRRSNTISTSLVGGMVDIVQAYRNFLTTSDRAYYQEVVYCAAKQLYWNMTQSRTLFQADFIELLKEFQKDFLLNPYLKEDKQIGRILEFLKKEVIPDNIICVHFRRDIPQIYLEELHRDFPNARLIEAREPDLPVEELPSSVLTALHTGNISYAEEYYALRQLYEHGGIVLFPDMLANLNLNRLRLNRVFFGFEDEEQLSTGCFGALKGHYVIQALLDSYRENNIFNKAFLPLKDRIRDLLILHFHLKVNGRNQLLENEVQIYLPSILAYDMKNGENCCKWAGIPVPEGFEVVNANVLKFWSDRLMENWNLYKRAMQANKGNGKSPPPYTKEEPTLTQGLFQREMEERIAEVIHNYETSTSWKLTKPIRALGRLFKRKGGTP